MKDDLILTKLRVLGFEASYAGKSHVVAQNVSKKLFLIYNKNGKRLLKYDTFNSNKATEMVVVDDELKIVFIAEDEDDCDTILIDGDTCNETYDYWTDSLWGNWVELSPSYFRESGGKIVNLKTGEIVDNVNHRESINMKIRGNDLFVDITNDREANEIMNETYLYEQKSSEMGKASLMLIVTTHLKGNNKCELVSRVFTNKEHYIIHKRTIEHDNETDSLDEPETQEELERLKSLIARRLKTEENKERKRLFRPSKNMEA